MISICIPAYNFDIRPLVKDLHRQGVMLKIDFEILIVDDASDESFRKMNATLSSRDQIVYHQLNKNTGRSRIRNLCASLASFDWIIFMDCDSQCPDDQYLKRYLEQTVKSSHVICGGRTYKTNPEEKETFLHWFYGKNREVRSAPERSRHPFRSFMTNNFMIRKDLFDRVRFHEDIEGYGHEDTLFGIDLHQHNVALTHIDNPLLHIGLQTDQEFLDKTRHAVTNLVYIYSLEHYRASLRKHVRLISAFEKVRKAKMTVVFAFLFPQWRSAVEKQLKSGKPRLKLLDIYKLGVFCQTYHSKRQNHKERRKSGEQ